MQQHKIPRYDTTNSNLPLPHIREPFSSNIKLQLDTKITKQEEKHGRNSLQIKQDPYDRTPTNACQGWANVMQF